MNRPARLLALPLLAAAATAAHAENYVAQVYAVPEGNSTMYVYGAGDNGMMSGYIVTPDFHGLAAYVTANGYKIMHPTGWDNSQITDSWAATYHCGYGNQVGQGSHALFWVGGGAAVDMHPPGAEYESSYANGGNGQLQAGNVQGSIVCTDCVPTDFDGHYRHAAVWNRSAASFRRLHSATHYNTVANCTDGVRIAGYGIHRGDQSHNALLWNSVTSMSINLRPSQSTFSDIYSMDSTQQGGVFIGPSTGGNDHACLWTGTAASAYDLHPPGGAFAYSYVEAVRNGLQVGRANPTANTGRTQAVAWHGNAATWINLHARLPLPYSTSAYSSSANGIDNLGNIIGHVFKTDGTTSMPVIWRRVP
jgi:hypothetical protein